MEREEKYKSVHDLLSVAEKETVKYKEDLKEAERMGEERLRDEILTLTLTLTLTLIGGETQR